MELQTPEVVAGVLLHNLLEEILAMVEAESSFLHILLSTRTSLQSAQA
jgi:hypothetical protein